MTACAESSAAKSKSDLPRRLLTGGLLSAVSLYIIFFGPGAFFLEVLLVGSIGAWEFFALAERKGFRPARRLGLILCLGIFAAAYLAGETACFRAVLFALMTIFTVLIFRGGQRVSTLVDAACTALGVIYVGWFFSFLILLRGVEGTLPLGGWKVPAGAALVTLLVTLNAFSDMGGYFIGRAWGRRKLFPSVSPKKTVEGAVGAVFFSLAVAMVLGGLMQFTVVHRLALGLLVPIFAQLGDLWESALKRDAGVKDSGSIMAGHGGVLDRFDSLAFATPVFYVYVASFML